jgi:hypothetical protein
MATAGSRQFLPSGIDAPCAGTVLATVTAMERRLEAIRRRIAAGTLPKDDCLVTWYSPGRGEQCDVCGRRLLSTHMGIHCDHTGGWTAHFHQRCYGLWYRVVKGEPLGESEER